MAEEATAIPTVNIDVAQERDRPRIEALLFADYAAITTSGKPDVCGIFGRILADPETKNTGLFYIFIKIIGVIGVPLELAITNPEGKTVAAGKILTPASESNEQAGSSEIQMIHVIQRMVLNVKIEGTHWFSVLYNGKPLGGAAVGIEFKKQGDSNDHVSD